MEQLTAILDMSKLITNPIFLFFIGFLGMVAHFLKKFQSKQLQIQADQIGSTILDYFFRVDLINTLLTVIAYVVGFVMLWTTNQVNVFGAFSAGYMADSLFNRASNGNGSSTITSSEVKPSGEGEL